MFPLGGEMKDGFVVVRLRRVKAGVGEVEIWQETDGITVSKGGRRMVRW